MVDGSLWVKGLGTSVTTNSRNVLGVTGGSGGLDTSPVATGCQCFAGSTSVGIGDRID